jgi:RimJ/RimL family protein N-acetyltransferase
MFVTKHDLTGIVYIYDYKEKYKTCNIGIGILKDFRGDGICLNIINIICKELILNGMNRIGLEVEDTNESSINMCKKLENIGFKYEGIRRNSYGIGINSLVFSLIKY